MATKPTSAAGSNPKRRQRTARATSAPTDDEARAPDIADELGKRQVTAKDGSPKQVVKARIEGDDPQANKDDQKPSEQAKTGKKTESQPWFNQISLLLVGGILTVLGNAGVAWFNGWNAINVEREKAKSSLILQAIASSDANVSFRNIMFFVESKLIADPDGDVVRAACKYLPVLPSVGAPTPQALTPADYEKAFWTVSIDQDAKQAIETAVKHIATNKARFETVGQATSTPWYVVGTIHWLEQRDRFDVSLVNGKLLEPASGSNTWEDDAIKSIRRSGARNLNGTDLGLTLLGIERYNGLGFQSRGGTSPYLWGRTSGYIKSATPGPLPAEIEASMARNPGAVAILRGLNDQSIIQLNEPGRPATASGSPSLPPSCATNGTGSSSVSTG